MTEAVHEQSFKKSKRRSDDQEQDQSDDQTERLKQRVDVKQKHMNCLMSKTLRVQEVMI